MKVLWASNAPMVGSGYGVQSGMFGPRVATLGHDLAYYANWGVQGWTADWNGFRIYPADGVWGNRTAQACALHYFDGDDGLIIWLCDAWVLDPSQFRRGVRQAIWAPVDQRPCPKPVTAVLQHETVTPIAMSRFGERMMVDAGLEPLYVPHGVETDVFTPRPDDKREIRREMGIPEDAFVVGMVAANQSDPAMDRKGFAQTFEAFADFAKTHRDAVLYVHTNEYPTAGGAGRNLRATGDDNGLTRKNLIFTEQFAFELGWSRETLASAYQAFDVLASASMGEGFGVPIIEAQASGVPVIVSDHSAMPELCGAGWTVEVAQYRNDRQQSNFAFPLASSIRDALEEAYNHAAEMGDAARAFALDYDADAVTERYWRPAMEALGAPQTAAKELVGV